jgi:hypothetical protein
MQMRPTASIVCLITLLCTLPGAARADMPASAVLTHSIAAGQSYPGVNANSEGWFDVGGFCKVVDVGDLSTIAPGAHGVPVFIPGPPQQWENYRTSAATNYAGKLILTTCCRPQANIAMLCTEAGATPISVSREYGKLGETDTLSAVCVDIWGKTYTDTVNVTCSGDNGPDGQAEWIPGGSDSTSNCIPNANITFGTCSASCGGGSLYETVQDSCGTVTAQGFIGPACNTQSCCVPNGSCSGGCGGGAGVDNCGGGCVNNAPCPPPPPVCTYVCNPTLYTCPPGSPGGPGPYDDCGAPPGCGVPSSCGGSDCTTGWDLQCNPPPCTPCFCSDFVNLGCSAAPSCCLGSGNCCGPTD